MADYTITDDQTPEELELYPLYQVGREDLGNIEIRINIPALTFQGMFTLRGKVLVRAYRRPSPDAF